MRLLDRFLDGSIRYGYATWRVAYWALLVWAIGAWVFFQGHRLGLLVGAVPAPEGIPQEWIPFNPLAYSADVLIPGISLHQQTKWEPIIPPLEHHGFALFLTIWTWVEMVLGWVLTSLGVAGFSGLIKKN